VPVAVAKPLPALSAVLVAAVVVALPPIPPLPPGVLGLVLTPPLPPAPPVAFAVLLESLFDPAVAVAGPPGPPSVPTAPSTPGVPGVPNTLIVTACAGVEEAAKSKLNVSGPSVVNTGRKSAFIACRRQRPRSVSVFMNGLPVYVHNQHPLTELSVWMLFGRNHRGGAER
jgi:hypothetical protein